MLINSNNFFNSRAKQPAKLRGYVVFFILICFANSLWAQDAADNTPPASSLITTTPQENTASQPDDDVIFGFGEEKKTPEKQVTTPSQQDIKTEIPTIITSEPKTSPTLNSNNNPENFTTGVTLRGLDKITARTSNLQLKLGQAIKFGNLSITLHVCWKSPPEEAPESKALLEMWEEIPGESRKKIFYGWMFASSPLISAPEHVIYDIIVLECTGEAVKKDAKVITTTP